MLIAFQIILFLLIVLFSLYLLAEDGLVTYEDKNRYTAIVLAAIIAETVCFII
ncbi:hypothetical protein [Neobacillus niacini]|uniref:hypothetical protein n=1 Tax=Neobacillus niacini TaxID=86668 RepID=UPI0021CB5771|nr:hypothetical protein [Neobacillus niacini]MCM3764618.1 hypothetical protein [Neobacillus niacini]